MQLPHFLPPSLLDFPAALTWSGEALRDGGRHVPEMDEGASGWPHSTALTVIPHLWESLMCLPGLAQGRVGVAAKQGLGVQ